MDSTTSLAKHSAVDSDHVVFVKKLAEYSHRLFVVVLATGNGHDLPKLFRQVGIQLESPFYLHCSGCWHLPELCNQPVVIQPHPNACLRFRPSSRVAVRFQIADAWISLDKIVEADNQFARIYEQARDRIITRNRSDASRCW